MLNLPIQMKNDVPVISSLELAKLCVPAVTKSGKPNKDQHADFMKKARLVLGSEGLGKFSDTYLDSQGKEHIQYLFPKREACLLTMSYSYELQAKVYDAWQAALNQVDELTERNRKLEIMNKQYQLTVAELDNAINGTQLTAMELEHKKMLLEHNKVLAGVQHEIDKAKMLGVSFDLNSYIKSNNLNESHIEHLREMKDLVGTAIHELGGIEKPYDAATNLLKKHGSPLRTIAFNTCLEVMGIINRTNDSVNVTEYGKRWGFNFKAGNTYQPRWYEDRFAELLSMVEEELNG